MLLSEWCDTHGDRGQQIKSEWTGKSVDGYIIDFYSATHGCGTRMYWKCQTCSHIWEATINNRTATKNSCPMCYEANRGKIVSKSKAVKGETLEYWCKHNKLGDKLLKEWTGLCEDGDTYSISDLSSQSNKKMLWICSNNNNHKWYAKIQKRTLLNSGCPYCVNQKVLSGENDLLTWCKENNKEYLINQFVGQLDDGTFVKMSEIAKSTHKKVKWRHITESGNIHEWMAAISDRTYKDSGCPLCTGMNNLKPGINDIETWCKNNPIFGKIIQEQWLGLNEHNNKVKMSEIACKSHTKLFWLCEKCNKPYLQDPVHKLYHKTISCNSCNPYGTSLPEQLLYRCIKQVYPNTISRGKFQGYEFDITIPELKTCIEYGSQYYHEGREQRDKEKQLLCKEHNVRFISILDSSGYDMDEVWGEDKIITTIDNDNKLNQVIYVILKTLGIDTSIIDYNKALGDSLDFLRRK